MLPSGAYVYNQYDSLSRLTNSFLFNSAPTPTPLDGHLYQYDRENQRTNEVRADSSTVAYTYDNIGQLKIANSSVPAENRGYFYDAAWNLNWRTNNGVASQFKVNWLNELTNSGAYTNWYDANGNMTNSYGWQFMTYDDENRLTVVSDDTYHSFHTTFAYDGLGRLRKRTEHYWTGFSPLRVPSHWAVSNSVEYIYDGWRVIQERDGNNTPLVSYTRGNDLSVSLEDAGGIGGLLARSSGYSAGNWTNHADYYADANGNVTSLIDSNQAVVASYRYDPFGNIISKSGTLADANVYRFSSKEVHVSSGLYYYGFRFYDPNLQRWINRDPIEEEGGINLYTFLFNDAANLLDAFGLIDLDVCVWDWKGLGIVGADGSVGHVMVKEAGTTNVLLSQFPHALGQPSHHKGPNTKLNYADTLKAEGRPPNALFRVHVPNDDAFKKAVADHTSRQPGISIPRIPSKRTAQERRTTA
jgi:RHS repeat-associated protein